MMVFDFRAYSYFNLVSTLQQHIYFSLCLQLQSNGNILFELFIHCGWNPETTPLCRNRYCTMLEGTHRASSVPFPNTD